MAGCGSCGGKKPGVKWELTLANGTKQKHDSVKAAHDAGKATGNTYTIRAVPA